MRRALLLLGLLWASPAPAAVCTLDPANVAANVTLSNGNLTWTTTSNALALGRGTIGYLGGTGSTNSSFKLYFEMKANTVASAVDSWGVGIDAGSDPTNIAVGGSAIGVGLYDNRGVWTNSAVVINYNNFTNGATVGVAVDFFHQKIWWTVDGSTWNNDIIANQNPAANLGGFSTWTSPSPFGTSGAYNTVFPAFGSISTSGNIGTFNGGTSSFTYTAPSGFSAWCGGPTITPQLFRVSP